MTDRLTLMRWVFGAVLVGVAILTLYVRLLAIDLTPSRIPGPDLFLALTFAWVLRRPDYAPIFLLAALFLLMDFLVLRVPGVWTLAAVIGIEFLRGREQSLRTQRFVVEWGFVVATLFGMLILQRAILTVFFVDQPPFGLALIEQIATALFYPFAALSCRYIFGIHKRQPGDDNLAGQAP